MRRMPLLATTFAAVLSLSPAAPARAAWPHDPYSGGLPVITASNHQLEHAVCPDGAGGAILAWQDYRGASIDIYAQRINAAGVTLWTANGVAVCTATGTQGAPAVTPDGAGGVPAGCGLREQDVRVAGGKFDECVFDDFDRFPHRKRLSNVGTIKQSHSASWLVQTKSKVSVSVWLKCRLSRLRRHIPDKPTQSFCRTFRHS